MEKQTVKKANKLGLRTWISLIAFGLIGQIAWMVENMYFEKFMQYAVTRETYATTLMVNLSAVAATVATLLMGAICDKTGKRKAFICWGYVLWGFTTMAFALLPINVGSDKVGLVVALVVLMDCVMSFVGSCANDASFNAWVTDVTDITNRAKVDVILSIMPLAAMAIVFVGLDSLTQNNSNWTLFFIILGIIPIVGGLVGLLVLKDAKNIQKSSSGHYWKDVFYGFEPKVIKSNGMLYVSLLGSAFSGASMQIYSPYLISIVEETMNIQNYIIPIAIIIVVAAIISVVAGILMDKYGKKHFYYPAIVMNIVGGVVIYLSKFFLGKNPTAVMALVIVGGIVLMGAALTMNGLFVASFRDYIPKGKEGSFQGIRIFTNVLIPMLIGPYVGAFIINTVNMRSESGMLLYPPELFLGAAAMMVLVFIPAFFARKYDALHREKVLTEIK